MNKPAASIAKATPSKLEGIARAKKKATTEQNLGGSQTTLSAEEVRQRVATSAYYHAEKRGFVQGGEEEDWLRAEREISQTLAS